MSSLGHLGLCRRQLRNLQLLAPSAIPAPPSPLLLRPVSTMLYLFFFNGLTALAGTLHLWYCAFCPIQRFVIRRFYFRRLLLRHFIGEPPEYTDSFV